MLAVKTSSRDYLKLNLRVLLADCLEKSGFFFKTKNIKVGATSRQGFIPSNNIQHDFLLLLNISYMID